MNKISRRQTIYILSYGISTVLEVALLCGIDCYDLFELYIFPLLFFKINIGDGMLLIILWMIPRIMMWLLGSDLYVQMFNDVYKYLITRGKSIKEIVNQIINKYSMFIVILFLLRTMIIYILTNRLSFSLSILYLLMTLFISLFLSNLVFILYISFVGNRSFTCVLILIISSLAFAKCLINYDSLVNIVFVHNSVLIVIVLYCLFLLSNILLFHVLKNKEL